MNECTYEIKFSPREAGGFYVILESSIIKIAYYKQEFVSNNYYHSGYNEYKKQLQECLSVCRDELIDRGLIEG